MNKNIVYGAIALTFIVAVLALVVGFSHSSVRVGTVPTIATQYPNISASAIAVGSGCDSAYTTCNASTVMSSLGLFQKGYELLTATGTAYQLSANDIQNYSTVGFIATTSTTITLPSASSFSSAYLPDVGDREDYEFINASSTGGVLTIAAGTNFYINGNAASSTFSKILVASSSAMFTITRTAAGVLSALMDIYK